MNNTYVDQHGKPIECGCMNDGVNWIWCSEGHRPPCNCRYVKFDLQTGNAHCINCGRQNNYLTVSVSGTGKGEREMSKELKPTPTSHSHSEDGMLLKSDSSQNHLSAVELVRELACFGDTGANNWLEETGSYSMFDEPNTVKKSRQWLASAPEAKPELTAQEKRWLEICHRESLKGDLWIGTEMEFLNNRLAKPELSEDIEIVLESKGMTHDRYLVTVNKGCIPVLAAQQQVVERVARAIWIDNGGIQYVWENMREKEGSEGFLQKQRCYSQAKAALSALPQQRVWTLEPVELTLQETAWLINAYRPTVDLANDEQVALYGKLNSHADTIIAAQKEGV